MYVFSTFVMRGLDRTGPVDAITAMRGINAEANSNPVFLLGYFGATILALVVGVIAVIQLRQPGSWVAVGRRGVRHPRRCHHDGLQRPAEQPSRHREPGRAVDGGRRPRVAGVLLDVDRVESRRARSPASSGPCCCCSAFGTAERLARRSEPAGVRWGGRRLRHRLLVGGLRRPLRPLWRRANRRRRAQAAPVPGGAVRPAPRPAPAAAECPAGAAAISVRRPRR